MRRLKVGVAAPWVQDVRPPITALHRANSSGAGFARVSRDACWTPEDAHAICVLYPYRYNDTVFIIRETEEFRSWLDGLRDMKAQVRIAARLRYAEGNLSDWGPIEGEDI